MTLPGDDLVADADAVETRGIDIDAPPERVWPWLVQMGYGRAGWYSYDALDMDVPSASTIEERWQALAVGDVMPTHPGGGFQVSVVEPPRALVLYLDRTIMEAQEHAAIDTASPNVRATGAYLDRAVSGDFSASWAFVLEPRDVGGTRLIERFRARMEAPDTARSFVGPARSFLGFGVFVMIRRQMLGIKARAEGRAEAVDRPWTPTALRRPSVQRGTG